MYKNSKRINISSRIRKEEVIKGFKYKGFQIFVFKSKVYGLKYSYSLKPVSQLAKYICYNKNIEDYTGSIKIKYLKIRAKTDITTIINFVIPYQLRRY